MMKRIKVFLASSAELKNDREQFEIFLGHKNKEWISKGLFLDLILWEDFLDCIMHFFSYYFSSCNMVRIAEVDWVLKRLFTEDGKKALPQYHDFQLRQQCLTNMIEPIW